jgi:hypothetical protein
MGISSLFQLERSFVVPGMVPSRLKHGHYKLVLSRLVPQHAHGVGAGVPQHTLREYNGQVVAVHSRPFHNLRLGHLQEVSYQ